MNLIDGKTYFKAGDATIDYCEFSDGTSEWQVWLTPKCFIGNAFKTYSEALEALANAMCLKVASLEPFDYNS